jgi:ankyrin repeat protein
LKELLTTPLHLACLNSNMDAVRILIEHHNVDVNILINEKNFLVDLLDTSGYKDFNILNIIFKKRRPQINSGCKLALNQAILRGNPFIIKTLLEFGNPNPFVRDSNGKSPIHMAAAKLDTDTFEHLIRLGADPMMPDDDGNTFLHLMAMGVIKDAEYDFIRNAVTKFNLKLTRNNEKRTALNIIKAYSGQSTSLRGQPNYKRKIWEFYEMRQKQDSSFIENEDDLPIQT